MDIVELLDEVLEDVTVSTERTMASLEILSDVPDNFSDFAVNITDEVWRSFTDESFVNLEELLESSSDLSDSIALAVDDILRNLENMLFDSGVELEDLPKEFGSWISMKSGEQKARFDIPDDNTEKQKRFESSNATVPGCWDKLKQNQQTLNLAAEIHVLADGIVKGMYEIISAIHDEHQQLPWKDHLTREDKTQLFRLQDAMKDLSSVVKKWKTAIEAIVVDTSTSYGTLEVFFGGRHKNVQVIDVMAYILIDVHVQLRKLQKTLSQGTTNLTVSDLNQLSNWGYTTFADIQAMIDIRNNKGKLVKCDALASFNFPPKEDNQIILEVLKMDFPQWKNKVKNQSFDLAKFGANMAIVAFVKSQVVLQVNDFLMRKVYPRIRAVAETAGIEKAKDYVHSQKDKIIELALIPIVGGERAREYGEKVKKVAIQMAKQAAIDAGNKEAKGRKILIQENNKILLSSVFDRNKTTLNLISKYAAREILSSVVPKAAHSKL